MTAAPAGLQSRIYMDTLVTIDLPLAPPTAERDAAVERAFGWFAEVEARCSRFDSESELRRLCELAGRPVAVSSLLFCALEFALAVAGASDGAFDPTVGAAMIANGFDRNYLTGEAASFPHAAAGATFRDVDLDSASQTVTLRRPLLLDLGAVAKGLAIDLAAAELTAFSNVSINAGGDLLLRGVDAAGEVHRAAIRHPRRHDRVLTIVEVPDGAVCTSGDYERRTARGHHLLDARSGKPAASASATVIAPTAMAADALATAALVLGPTTGLRLLEDCGVAGLIVAADLRIFTTSSWPAGAP